MNASPLTPSPHTTGEMMLTVQHLPLAEAVRAVGLARSLRAREHPSALRFYLNAGTARRWSLLYEAGFSAVRDAVGAWRYKSGGHRKYAKGQTVDRRRAMKMAKRAVKGGRNAP